MPPRHDMTGKGGRHGDGLSGLRALPGWSGVRAAKEGVSATGRPGRARCFAQQKISDRPDKPDGCGNARAAQTDQSREGKARRPLRQRAEFVLATVAGMSTAVTRRPQEPTPMLAPRHTPHEKAA